jgi:NMD protein affecting ribosome stability and mRNA decay
MSKTFVCEECGEDTPIEQIGLDEMCDDCFDDNYPDMVCRNTNLLTDEICYYQAEDRIDLEKHWDESPNHSE